MESAHTYPTVYSSRRSRRGAIQVVVAVWWLGTAGTQRQEGL